MIDQAQQLRFLAQVQPKPKPVTNARVITVTSGKGGVGKTNFVVNLAVYLRQKGKRVVILDADFGLPNIEVLFGVIPKHSLTDVFDGRLTIDNVLTDGPVGIKFLSGGSGLNDISSMGDSQLKFLIKNFELLDANFDFIIVDTGAGISQAVISFVKASQETILITTPEPTSVMDAYALMKTVKENSGGMPSWELVVNRVEDSREGADIYEKLAKVAGKFLGIKLESLGCIEYDPMLVKAVKRQEPTLTMFPTSLFARAMVGMGNTLLDIETEQRGGFITFVKKLSNVWK